MSQQTFAVSEMPRIVITRVKGDLSVKPWDQREVSVDVDGRVGGIQQEGDALLISDCSSDLELMMPSDASIKVSSVGGDVEISGVRRVELENVGGDVELQDISGDASAETIGEAVDLTNIGGDLSVSNVLALRVRRRVGGSAELAQIGQIEMEAISGDCEVQSAGTVMIAAVAGDLEAQDISTVLRCGVVSGDCEVQGSAAAQVAIGNTGGSLEIGGAASVQAGNVRGDCEINDVMTDVEVGNISGDLECRGVGGNVRIGRVAGDAELNGITGSVEISTVGGDLELQSSFPPDSHTQIKIGGEATITLPDNPNVRISAVVGGDVSGIGIVATSGGNMVNLVYGDGNAYLDLKVGGDLDLHSFDQPRSSSSMGGMGSGAWNDFGREMADFGREMGKLGQELSREISEAVKNAGWSAGSDVAEEVRRKTEESVRRARQRAEEDARRSRARAEENARRAQQHSSRVNVRFNEREWRMDPARLNRILEQAKQAADEGVFGALEAVERALRNIHIPNPPNRPTPPNPPAPPTPPRGSEGSEYPASSVEPVQPVSPVEPVSPVTSSFAGQEQGEGQNANPEQEREAILRMIAEGRITPEEGDMLLEALGE